jgi:hypothetical protein
MNSCSTNQPLASGTGLFNIQVGLEHDIQVRPKYNIIDYKFGQTLLSDLSLTLTFNKPASGLAFCPIAFSSLLYFYCYLFIYFYLFIFEKVEILLSSTPNLNGEIGNNYQN